MVTEDVEDDDDGFNVITVTSLDEFAATVVRLLADCDGAESADQTNLEGSVITSSLNGELGRTEH